MVPKYLQKIIKRNKETKYIYIRFLYFTRKIILTVAFLLNPTDDTCLLGRTSLVKSKLDRPPESAVPAIICDNCYRINNFDIILLWLISN